MKTPFKIDLTNKVIVITGGGGTLCSVFAKAYASCGAKVALLSLTKNNAQRVQDEILKEGGIAKSYQCNVLDKKSIQEAHDKIVSELGTCDILVNGAGGNNPKATCDNEYYHTDDLNKIRTFFDLEQEDIEYVLNLNYMGSLLTTQIFALDMINKTGASIINISSMNAYTPLTKIPAYSGAKAAISNFTQWLAVHFSKVGIRCNAIAPGFFISKQNEKLLFNEDGSPTARSEKILRNTPIGRFGREEELVGVMLFLACYEASSFVNGVVIPIDGGFNAYSGV